MDLKSDELIDQERKLLVELIKYLNLFAERYEEGLLNVKVPDNCGFLIVAAQPPDEARSLMLSGHLITPATLASGSHEDQSYAKTAQYGVTSTVLALLSERFKEIGPEMVETATEIQKMSLEGGNA